MFDVSQAAVRRHLRAAGPNDTNCSGRTGANRVARCKQCHGVNPVGGPASAPEPTGSGSRCKPFRVLIIGIHRSAPHAGDWFPAASGGALLLDPL